MPKKTKIKEEILHGINTSGYPHWIKCGAKGEVATLDPKKMNCNKCHKKKDSDEERSDAIRKVQKGAFPSRVF